MAGKKQFPNGKWQYVFKRKGVLEKPLYLTFDTEAEGDEYADRLAMDSKTAAAFWPSRAVPLAAA